MVGGTARISSRLRRSSLAKTGTPVARTYAGGSPQGSRSSPSPVCQQAKFLLSDSGESDSPVESVPPS